MLKKYIKRKPFHSFIKLFNEGREQGYINSEVSDEAILFYLKMFQEYLQREDVGTMTLPIAEDLTKLFFYGITGRKED